MGLILRRIELEGNKRSLPCPVLKRLGKEGRVSGFLFVLRTVFLGRINNGTAAVIPVIAAGNVTPFRVTFTYFSRVYSFNSIIFHGASPYALIPSLFFNGNQMVFEFFIKAFRQGFIVYE